MRILERRYIGAFAAMALAVLLGAGGASAETTELFSGNTTLTSGTVIEVSLASGTTAVMTDTSGELANTCSSGSASGKTANTTGSSVGGTGSIIGLSGCTWTLNTVNNGGFSAERIEETNDATVTGSGQIATVLIFGFLDCFYSTGGGTHLGTVDGVLSGHATLEIDAVIKLEEGSFCPETTRLQMDVVITSPTGLNFRF